MSINGIETQAQNYGFSGAAGTKSSGSAITPDSFQAVIANWQKQTKDAIDKQQENDKKGTLQMSEKHWRNLMKKVDSAIGAIAEDNKKKQETKNDLAQKELTLQDAVAGGSHTQETNAQFLEAKTLQVSGYVDLLSEKGKRE